MSKLNQTTTELTRVNSDDPDVEYIGSHPDVNWKGEPFTGIIFEIQNNRIINEITYVDGSETGPYKTWYPDGQIESEGESKLNRSHGFFRAWHPSGKLQYEGLAELGHVIWRKEWDEEGNLVSEQKIEDYPHELRELQAIKSWNKHHGIS
jgi:MORN repeat variant